MIIMEKNGQVTMECILDTSFMDACILLEKHNPKFCTCSYCRRKALESNKINIWLPECSIFQC